MKNCNSSLKNKIVEYYYGELSVQEKTELEKHLINCKACSREFKLIIGALEKVSKLDRPKLSGSLFYSIKEKLENSRSSSMKFWQIPLAAGAAFLIILSFVSYNSNMSFNKEIDLDEAYLISTALEMDSKDTNNFDLDMLTDEVFDEVYMEENLMLLEG